MVVKMNLSIITKNDGADPKIGFLTKLISKPYNRETAMPPAWEFKNAIDPESPSRMFWKFLKS